MKTPEDEAFEEIERIQRTRTRWVSVKKPQDEIIELAKQSDLMADGEMWFSPTYGNADVHITDLERFAKLVAEKEREACAKLVEPTEEHRKEAQHYIGGEEGVELLDSHAAAIRARGQA
jgi:hypothetical protein